LVGTFRQLYTGDLGMTISEASFQLFHEYFLEWIELYKLGAIRPVTYQKYAMTLQRLTELAPNLKVGELTKRNYQALLNEYAKTHERQTTLDFHRHLRSAILDAIDEGVLTSDPTRKIIIKGKEPAEKLPKFLSQKELQILLKHLNLAATPNWDWLILLIAKTGTRFSEALALTPNDFDFESQRIVIAKTWNYKSPIGGFEKTKNVSSQRTIKIDPVLNEQLFYLTANLAKHAPIFVNGRTFNSTVNSRLKVLCQKAGVPTISLHGLRHTHASLLIYAEVSIASISKRLGHSSITTTQETYLHIIKELEDRDSDIIVECLTMLN